MSPLSGWSADNINSAAQEHFYSSSGGQESSLIFRIISITTTRRGEFDNCGSFAAESNIVQKHQNILCMD